MKFNTKYLWALIPIAIIGFLTYYFSDILMYVILAWVVSMLGAPLMGFLRKYLNKNLAAALTLFSFVAVLFLVVWTFVPTLTIQAKNITSIDYEKLTQRLEEPVEQWQNWMEEKGLIDQQDDLVEQPELKSEKEDAVSYWINVDSIQRARGDTSLVASPPIAIMINLNHDEGEDLAAQQTDQNISFFDGLKKGILSFINPSRIKNFFGSFIGFFGNLAIALMSIFFIAFFFLREQGLFDNIIASIVPDKYEKESLTALNESSALLIRYLIGVMIQIIMITIFVSIILKLLGVPNALLIGFFAALMNVIPYVGPLFGGGFGVIITISSNLDLPFYGGMLPMIIKVLVVIAIMQLLDNFILQPTISGQSVKAHPLEIFLIILVAAKLGGILGMVVAIPVYTVFRVIAKVFFSEFKVVQRITQNL